MNNEMLARLAYERWLSSLYGDINTAYMRGVKTWENLPLLCNKAWEDTVAYVGELVLAEVMLQGDEEK